MNLLKHSAGIVSDFIGAELAAMDTENVADILDALNTIAINPSLLLNERDRINFETDINSKYDSDVITLLNDAAMDLYMNLEGEETGLYGKLVTIVDGAINEILDSTIIPDQWRGDAPSDVDIGNVIRLILGYAMRDINPAGNVAE